jgi:hypothetical protein
LKLETIIENFAALAVVPAALLYFSGYIYLYFFCRHLGIDPASLHYDLFTVMIYAVNALIFPLALASVHWLWTLGGIVTLAAAVPALHWAGKHMHRRWGARIASEIARPLRFAARTSAVLGAIILLFLISQMGGAARAEDALRLDGPAVHFQFTNAFLAGLCEKDQPCGYDDLKAANNGWCLRKLIETEGDVIVACRPPGSDLVIYVVPKSAITLEILQRS